MADKHENGGRMQFSGSEVLLLVVVVLIFCIAFLAVTIFPQRPPPGELMDLLFGAASVALFMLSFLVAVLAIFGWQAIREVIRERVDAAVQQKIESLSSRVDNLGIEVQGRLLLGLSAVFAMDAFDGAAYGVQAKRPASLEVAIHHAKMAHKMLESIQSPRRLVALNNLLYYKAAAAVDSDFVLATMDKIREHSVHATEYRQDYQLTYCRCVLSFVADEAKRQEVRRMLEEIRDRPEDPEKQKEARLYLTSFLEDYDE